MKSNVYMVFLIVFVILTAIFAYVAQEIDMDMNTKDTIFPIVILFIGGMGAALITVGVIRFFKNRGKKKGLIK
jgi:hypothetical protein